MSKKNKKKSLLTEGEMLRWKELTGQKDAYDPDFWLNEGDYKKEKMKETPPQDMKQKYLEEEGEAKKTKKPGKVDHSHPDHKLKTVKEGESMEDLDEMGYKRDEKEPMMEEEDDDLDDMEMGGDDMPPMDDGPEMDDMGGDDMPPMDDGPEMGGAPSVEKALQDLVAALKSELAAGEDIEATVVDDEGPEMDDMGGDDMGGDDMPPMDDDEEEALAEKIEEMLNRHEQSLAQKVAKRLKKKQ